MQKIYVLLRHDQQTGPYSLEELIQFDLKPYDLIWIEGKSAGWYYPQEIGALHPHLAFLPKKPAVVQPAAKAPEVQLSQPVLPEMPATKNALPEQPFIATPVSANLEEKVYAQFQPVPVKEEPAARFNPAPLPGKKQTGTSLSVALAVVLVVGGVFAASWIMNRQPNDSLQATTPPATSAVQEALATDAVSGDAEDKPAAAGKPVTQKQQKASLAKTQTAFNTTKNNRAARQTQVVTEVNTSAETGGNAASNPVETKPPVIQEETTEMPAETSAPVEKKKKLREKFIDLFKKKPEEQKQEETGADTNGERSASRRENGTNLAQLVHVRFDIPNDWMMGIKGARATLINRSNQTITKTVVEVQYFDDENNLLQKKTITFGKIDGKESKTTVIPDHPSATKVDYSIVSATGQPAA